MENIISLPQSGQHSGFISNEFSIPADQEQARRSASTFFFTVCWCIQSVITNTFLMMIRKIKEHPGHKFVNVNRCRCEWFFSTDLQTFQKFSFDNMRDTVCIYNWTAVSIQCSNSYIDGDKIRARNRRRTSAYEPPSFWRTSVGRIFVQIFRDRFFRILSSVSSRCSCIESIDQVPAYIRSD